MLYFICGWIIHKSLWNWHFAVAAVNPPHMLTLCEWERAEECKLNITKQTKQRVTNRDFMFTVLLLPLSIGTAMTGERACSHSIPEPHAQSTSDKYADWYWYPQWRMTFCKLYGTLRPGSGHREGAMREADHERERKKGKEREREGGKDGWGRWSQGTQDKHFEIWTRLQQQCPLFIQSDKDTLAKQISASWDWDST